MPSVTLQIPQVGLSDGTEDPKVASNFTLLQTLLNGGLDTVNLAGAANIALAQLATGARRLTNVSVSVNATAVDGQFVNVQAGGKTITLPSPVTANQMVGVRAGLSNTGATPTTVTTPSGSIFGLGLGASSFLLGTQGATVVLLSDGTNWLMTEGQQDTGWVALGLSAGFAAAGASAYTPSARLVGDRAYLKGAIANNTGGSVAPGTTIATVSSASRPSQTVYLSAILETTVPAGVAVGSAGIGGVVQPLVTMPAPSTLSLDGVSYTLS